MALVFVCRTVWPQAAIFGSVLTDPALLRIGGLVRLLLLFVATLFAALSARRLESDNPARLPWRLLALGLGGFFLGQSCLGRYQILLQRLSPFPSVADVFFVAAYPVLLIALVGFVRAYRQAGYPVGTTGEHLLVAGGAVLLFAWPAYRLVTPILAAPATPLEHALNAGYPLLDLLVLLPILVLTRIAMRFRGGKVARVWALLLAGFFFLCAADILFAYFAVLAAKDLEPLLDGAFVLAYLLLAAGAREQYRLLTE
jgi:hypothetical protein